jgi:hypothetical protein
MVNNINDCIQKDIVAEYILYPLREDLIHIPGMQEDSIDVLKNIGIYNTYQLVGLFLSFRNESRGSLELYETIISYLKCKGFAENVELVVRTVIEKIDTLMPGFCDMSEIYNV